MGALDKLERGAAVVGAAFGLLDRYRSWRDRVAQKRAEARLAAAWVKLMARNLRATASIDDAFRRNDELLAKLRREWGGP